MSLTELLFEINHVQIGSIEVDATISEEHSSEAEVTQHPVEEGSAITDHIRPKPRTLRLTGVISDTPIEFLSFDQGDRAGSAWQNLLELQISQKPVTIVTTLDEYNNMVLTSITCPRDAKRGNVIEFTATFQQITTVSSEVVSVDTPRPRVKRIGNQATGTAKAATRGSLLSKLTALIGF